MIHTLRQTTASLQQFNRALKAHRRERSDISEADFKRNKRNRKIANASRRAQRKH